MNDLADAYREHTFPGKKLITIGFICCGLLWLSSRAFDWTTAPKPVNFLLWTTLIASSIIYLIGYWKAIIGKGYPPILWIALLTGFIGVIIIFFLPNKSIEQV